MFKSRARREAERQLKIQQEKENILAEQQRRQARSAQQQERTQALLRSIGLWYGNLSTRNKAVVAVGGLALMFGLGQYGATPPETATLTVDEPVANSEIVIPSPIVAESTPASPVPRALTEAEQFKQVVMSNTDGLLALDRMEKMPPEVLFAQRTSALELISYGMAGGLSLEDVKQRFADQLQMDLGLDAKLSFNLSNGLIEGSLAWERGERPQGQQVSSVASEAPEPVAATEQSEAITSSPVTGQIGRLTASSANARINLRDEPNANTPTNRYGLEGDRVVLQDTTSGSDGYTWHKVQFQESGAIGWIRADFVEF